MVFDGGRLDDLGSGKEKIEVRSRKNNVHEAAAPYLERLFCFRRY
jgi:hypothetical protein